MTRSEQLFEDRYGSGSFQRLMTMLDQPCMTFAAIADHFGVTRERVRQWHVRMRPSAPRGHERQRQCALRRSKRRLLRHPLFRTFYRHARDHFEPGRLALIAGRDGFRATAVRLDGHMIAIRKATVKYQNGKVVSYGLSGGAAAVDFLYYRLSQDEFLLVPKTAMPPGGVSYGPSRESSYEAYRNTFAAVAVPRLARQAS